MIITTVSRASLLGLCLMLILIHKTTLKVGIIFILQVAYVERPFPVQNHDILNNLQFHSNSGSPVKEVKQHGPFTEHLLCPCTVPGLFYIDHFNEISTTLQKNNVPMLLMQKQGQRHHVMCLKSHNQ